MQEQNEKSGVGALVGIIVVILMLVVGAFYFYNQGVDKQNTIKNNQIQIQTQTKPTEEDITNIEKDANSVNTDNLGTGIDQL